MGGALTSAWERRLLLAGVVAAAALCAAGTVAAGPLSEAAGGGGLCAPSPTGGPVTASYPLPNSGPGIVTIDHVRLVDPEGLTLEAAHVVPGRFVMGGPYPPDFTSADAFPELLPAWEQRVDAVGALVPPGFGHDLVVGLRPSGPGESSIDGVEIAYSEGGRSYLVTSLLSVTVRAGSSACGFS
ncbi:hypothetical protein [Jiangella mangrovi]|uniref:Secreted protein n=1 Tax=Jiangella mangrovi TaxID=1524084 RepID=A0A7W9GS83_9ACTN|nr:hypothetical protein [Jiangella mangrovi]MBB5789095.1 hypothetical protein [Jiangella mangrovi]